VATGAAKTHRLEVRQSAQGQAHQGARNGQPRTQDYVRHPVIRRDWAGALSTDEEDLHVGGLAVRTLCACGGQRVGPEVLDVLHVRVIGGQVGDDLVCRTGARCRRACSGPPTRSSRWTERDHDDQKQRHPHLLEHSKYLVHQTLSAIRRPWRPSSVGVRAQQHGLSKPTLRDIPRQTEPWVPRRGALPHCKMACCPPRLCQ
jgi:hypothetical protein